MLSSAYLCQIESRIGRGDKRKESCTLLQETASNQEEDGSAEWDLSPGTCDTAQSTLTKIDRALHSTRLNMNLNRLKQANGAENPLQDMILRESGTGL